LYVERGIPGVVLADPVGVVIVVRVAVWLANVQFQLGQ